MTSKGSIALTVSALVLAAAPMSLHAQGVFGVITSEQSAITDSVRAWLDGVNERLEGGYEYNLVAGGALIGSGTEIPGFQDGLVDGGMVSVLYAGAELPVINMLANASLLVDDSRAGGAAFAETVLLNCETCLDELIENNIMPIGPYATSPYSLFCREPVESVADLEGRTVRARGVLGELAARMGAVPVNLGVSEIYEGLQRGQLDCTVFSAGAATAYSYEDVAPHIVNLAAGPVTGPTAMSLRYDLWESMDTATRQAFVDAAPAAATVGIYGYYNEDLEVLGNPDAYGVTVVEPSEEMQALIDEVTQESIELVLEEASERGVEDPEGIMNVYRETLAKWEGILEEIGDDEEAYTAALQSEIYDNFPIDR
ncbi:hypothetical protein HKCCE2091_03580 [Rhodobacterales bacterium HKCCE2091]|nr:hypothetical protein [Rhodobacterales bacterium HKCCE2091]